MTKIKLVNFRKWTDITFDLGDKITKITGESGIGKSTIFEAIYWCLYGKVRLVAPKGKNVKTEVLLEMSLPSSAVPLSGQGSSDAIVQVHRSGQKNISLQIDQSLFMGDIAQSKIDTIFGSSEMFLLTSYLRAESVHPLISSSPAEKRELTALVFPDASKFDAYRARCIEIRHRDEQELRSTQNRFLVATSSISTLEESNSWLKDAEDINETSIPSEKNILLEMNANRKKIEEIHRLSSLYSSYQEQLLSLPPSIDVAPLEQELQSIQQQLLQSSVETKTKEEKIRYIKERISSQEEMMSSLKYPLSNVQECTRILSLCDELLSIAPSLSYLEQKIQETDEETTKQSFLLLSYEKSLSDIEYNNKLEEVLECPCCQAKLQHTDKLVAYTGDTVPRTVEHSVTNGDVQKVRILVDKLGQKKQELIKSYNRYQDILSKNKLSSPDINEMKLSCQEYLVLSREKDTLTKNLSTVLSDEREYITKEEKLLLEEKVSTLKGQITQASSVEYSRKNLLSSVEGIEKQHSWLSSKESALSELEAEAKKLSESLSLARSLSERLKIQKMYKAQKKVYDEHKAEVTRRETRIRDSHKLEHILAQSYQEYVSDKLKEIEYDICLLGKIFFDDTMNITLTPGKETSTGGIRPSFDVAIEYGGTAFDDIKALSTGERKRLSIIFLMVLTKYTNGKIMLLDEAFASVSLDTRGIIMNELSRLSIPIYLTSHDELIGYTNELDLNQVPA